MPKERAQSYRMRSLGKQAGRLGAAKTRSRNVIEDVGALSHASTSSPHVRSSIHRERHGNWASTPRNLNNRIESSRASAAHGFHDVHQAFELLDAAKVTGDAKLSQRLALLGTPMHRLSLLLPADTAWRVCCKRQPLQHVTIRDETRVEHDGTRQPESLQDEQRPASGGIGAKLWQ